MKIQYVVASFFTVGSFSLAAWSTGCGSSSNSTFDNGGHTGGGNTSGNTSGDGGGDFDGTTGPGLGTAGDGARGCVGLQCQQHACAGNPNGTTVSGKVYDPAGNNPLYNVVVYVPDGVTQIQPIVNGVQPDTACSCSSLYTGNPIATTLTDAKGQFTLPNVPDGTNIPLVIQIGKWRKLITLPNVSQCTDNPQPDKSLKFQTSGSDHGPDAPNYPAATVDNIPSIAISTGFADSLECLLQRVGLAKTEYTPGAGGTGHIHIFQGKNSSNPIDGPSMVATTPDSITSLWDKSASLSKYDIVVLSCQGDETQSPNQQALHDYTNGGGRVFASHFHYAWFNSGPYASENLATWTAGTNNMGDINANIIQTLPDGGVFPKGQALDQWLGNVHALGTPSGTPAGELHIQQARHNADVGASNTPSQAWIAADNSATPAKATQYFSFNTPISPPLDDAGEPIYCGRVVYSDLHVGAASGDYQSALTVPEGCASNALSPQEDALEFMLFDLSSCVTPDSQKPQPPPVR